VGAARRRDHRPQRAVPAGHDLPPPPRRPPSPNDSTITPWGVREAIPTTGVLAALQEWQRALDLNAEALESQRRRGATDTDQARTAFNNYGPLLRLGRAAEARDLLRRCRDIFETANDIPALGKALSALADAEDELGHLDRAIDLEKTPPLHIPGRRPRRHHDQPPQPRRLPGPETARTGSRSGRISWPPP
jgi:tetratricopeptide (TPR) repeat protein